MKVQPLLVPLVPSISVNSAFFRVLQPKAAAYQKKEIFFAFSGQNGANLASGEISGQPQQAHVESYGRGGWTSYDDTQMSHDIYRPIVAFFTFRA